MLISEEQHAILSPFIKSAVTDEVKDMVGTLSKFTLQSNKQSAFHPFYHHQSRGGQVVRGRS